MKEKDIENKLASYCKSKDVLFLKWTSPSNRGVPDRILIGANGNVAFLELKRQGQTPSKLQRHVLDKLYKRRCFTGWVDNVTAGIRFIDNFRAWDLLR